MIPESPPVDAAHIDAAPVDAPPPDATIDAATLQQVTVNPPPGSPWGATFEVTDWGGYIPNQGNANLRPGRTVTWAYADNGQPHTLTSGSPGVPDGIFDVTLAPVHGAGVVIRFDVAGVYPYHCKNHGGAESATITVAGDPLTRP